MRLAPLAEVTRRDVHRGTEEIESRHHGHLVVVGPGGAVAGALGDPERPTFVRSAAKPFQAAASMEVAGPLAGDLTEEEIAVGWASHRGEPRHLAAVEALLRRSGTAPGDLTTPVAAPKDDPTAAPTRICHNCSGKHALFALAGRAAAVPREALLDPDGKLQSVVLGVLGDALGEPTAVAVDGCGAPAVQVPLHGLAAGFRRLWLEDRWARVRRAGLAHPGLVGGEGRLETALLGVGVLAKVGAEGVYGASWRDGDDAWGVAIKAEDGEVRGASVALHELLVALGVAARDVWSPEPVLGGGEVQGRVRASTEIPALARRLGS